MHAFCIYKVVESAALSYCNLNTLKRLMKTANHDVSQWYFKNIPKLKLVSALNLISVKKCCISLNDLPKDQTYKKTRVPLKLREVRCIFQNETFAIWMYQICSKSLMLQFVPSAHPSYFEVIYHNIINHLPTSVHYTYQVQYDPVFALEWPKLSKNFGESWKHLLKQIRNVMSKCSRCLLEWIQYILRILIPS